VTYMELVLDLASRLVKTAVREGFEEAAARVTRMNSVMVKIANSEVSVAQSWDNLMIALYLAKDKRILTLTLQPSDMDRLDNILRDNLSLSSRLRENPFYARLPEPSPVSPLGGLVDKRVVEAMEDPSDLTEGILQEASDHGVERAAGAVSLGLEEKAVVTSSGAELREEATSVEAYVRAFIGEASGQWAFGSRHLDKRRITEVVAEAAEWARKARGEQRQIDPGTYDVLLSPLVVGNLMNLVGFMSSAFAVMMGLSMFSKAKPGDKVASENMSVMDDPRTPELLGSTSFDDEGVETTSKFLIEGGVLRTFIHNTKTAAAMKTKSTGNAGWVMPRVWNLRVSGGDASLDEMVGEMRRGVIITNNWYTRLQNYVEGVFSTIARDAAFYVENGEIKYPVARVRIADRLSNLLSNADLAGKELYDVSWWEVRPAVRAPFIMARNINISRPFE